MKETGTAGLAGHLRASWHLFVVSFRRQLRSRQTVVSLMLLACAALAVVAWSLRHERSAAEFIEDIFLTVYVSFLLPVFCLSYASAGIAAEREERTLVYLLMTPLPRPLVLISKSAAALVLATAWTIGSMFLLSWLAGRPALHAARALAPGVFWSTWAYVALFTLFSVVFQRATIVALCYALFLEVFVGAMPGIAKRLAISFYTRCLILDASRPFGIEPAGPYEPSLFLPIPASAAQMTLYGVCAGLWVISLVTFATREYSP